MFIKKTTETYKNTFGNAPDHRIITIDLEYEPLRNLWAAEVEQAIDEVIKKYQYGKTHWTDEAE